VPTFENGWICKNCWKANREQDVRCYRCHQLSPEYRIVPVEPRERVPRTPRKPILRPVLASMKAAVKRMWTGASRLVLAAVRHSFNALRLAGLLVGGGVGKVALALRSVVLAARRLVAAAAGLVFAGAARVGRGALRVASVIGSTALGAIRLAAAGVAWVLRLAAATGHAAGSAVSNAAFALTRVRRHLGGGLHAILANGRRLLVNRHI
jgi:hypothetical protein